MKRFFAIAVLALFAAAITSCSGGNKACAAYTKHDTGERPVYSDVQ